MSEWIKVDKDTPNKLAIRHLAQDCRVSQGDAFLAFFRLYSWFDGHTADGDLHATRDDVDWASGLPGCAASLERSGWLHFCDGVCMITNYGEHNGNNAKRRAQQAALMNARRKAAKDAGDAVRTLPQPVRPVRPPAQIVQVKRNAR